MKILEFRSSAPPDALAGGSAEAPAWSAERALGGRDVELPAWLAQPPERGPRFDSVVVRGSGIGALTTAARLARSEHFAGRVTVAGPKLEATPRLIGGCTLRVRALDYVALALGRARLDLVNELYGDEETAHAAATFRQRAVYVHDKDAAARLGRSGTWMQASSHALEHAVAFGIRNGNLRGILERAVEGLDVRWVDEVPASRDECLDLARGEQPLLVDAAHKPMAEGRPGPAVVGWVAASQVTLRRSSRETDAEMPLVRTGDAMIAAVYRGTGLDLAVFYPFADELTPQANYYGIFYRMLPLAEKERGDQHVAELRSRLQRVATALGLHPISEQQTRGEAIVPRYPWGEIEESTPGVLHLQRTYDACAPIIAGDGMARSALGGWLASEAILRGQDPSRAVNRALRRWRRANRHLAWVMTSLAPMAAPLLRSIPGPGVRLVANVPDMWAGVG